MVVDQGVIVPIDLQKSSIDNYLHWNLLTWSGEILEVTQVVGEGIFGITWGNDTEWLYAFTLEEALAAYFYTSNANVDTPFNQVTYSHYCLDNKERFWVDIINTAYQITSLGACPLCGQENILPSEVSPIATDVEMNKSLLRKYEFLPDRGENSESKTF